MRHKNEADTPGTPDAGAPPFRCGRVAIVGRPSVGKSTLLNALLGQKLSITSNKPQTTRHRITGILTEPQAQFIFVDTPGFQRLHRSRLNERLNRAVREALADVDVVLLVLDAARIVEADRDVIALLPDAVAAVAAINKIDAVKDKSALLPRLAAVARLHAFAALIPVSAEKGTQLTALKTEIAKALPQSDPLYPADDLTDRDERFLAAEFIREKIFRMLGDEVPYATTVGIDSFALEGDLRRIHATVYVAKTGQRGMLLGENGSRMKAIASQARADMERLFGGRVFLEVWVKVKPKWAESEMSLTRFGY
ncbi:MAG: GTPase Era [Pyrinomonadaceae bacterium]|nr:GTPase Era [Pyrinomonadaceae bacterium]